MTDSNLIPQEENTVPEGAFGIGSKATDDVTSQYIEPQSSTTGQFGKQAAGLGIEIGGGMATDVATAPLLAAGPYGWLAYGGINFGAGASLNIAAQKARGEEKINWGEVVSSGVLQTIPFGVEGKGLGSLARSGVMGGTLAIGDQVIQKGIDEQRLPTFKESRNAALLGTGLGIGFKGSADKIQELTSKIDINKFVGKTADEINQVITPKEIKQLEEISSEIDIMNTKANRFGIDDIQGDTIDDIDATKTQAVDAFKQQLKNDRDTLPPRNIDGEEIDPEGFYGIETDEQFDDVFKVVERPPVKPYKTNLEAKRGLSRGADNLKKRLRLEVNTKGADPNEVEAIETFIDTIGERMFDKEALSITTKLAQGGEYNFANSLIRIRKQIVEGVEQGAGGGFEHVMIHELWHSLSRYLPKQDLARYTKEFKTAQTKYLKQFEKEKIAFVRNNTPESLKQKIGRSPISFKYPKITEANYLKKARDYFDKSKFKNENYRFTNIDEFFAENMADEFMDMYRGEARIAGSPLDFAPQGTFKRIVQETKLFVEDLFVSLRARLGGSQTRKIFNDFVKRKNVKKYRDVPLDLENVEGITGMAKKKTQDLGDENILPRQVNVNQLASTPRQARFLEKVLRGMKLEEDGSGFYRVKTVGDTTDEAVELMANADELKELAKLMQQIYKILPSDSLNVALSGYVKLTSGSIANQTKSLQQLTNIDIPLDNIQQIEEGAELLIKHFDDYDEWLRLGIPLRSEAGRGLGSLAFDLENFSISKEEYLKLSIPERKKLQQRNRGDADIAVNYQSTKIKDLQKNLKDTLAKAKETGDFTKFNKFLNTIDLAKGNPEKIKRLFEYGLLDRLLSPNTYLRPLNEILINGVLFAPTIHEINILSNVIMAYKTPLKLALDPRNIVQPERYKASLLHLIYMHSDLNYSLKAMGESWQKQENILNPGARKLDYPEQFATYVDTTDLTGPQKWLAQIWNPIGTFARSSGRAMTSTDALFHAGNIRGATVSSSFLEGMKLGLTGEDLSKFTIEKSNLVWKSITEKTGKNITEEVEARILKSSLELGKRNTFTQDIRTDGDIVGPTAKGLQDLAKIPIVRRFQMFTRSPANIIKEGFRDTPGINLLMKEFRNDLKSSDPLVQAETMGQLSMSILATGGFISLINMQNLVKVETQDQVKERKKAGNPPRVVLTGGGVNTSTAEGRGIWWADWKTGWRPYSAGFLQFDKNGDPKIGEDGEYVYVYHSYKRLDPLSSYIGFLVDGHQVQEHLTDGQYGDMMSAFLVAFGRNFTDRTFTQGVGDAANLWLNPGKAEKWFARQGASNIPGSGLFRYLKQVPKDLLQMNGVPDSEIEKWVVKRDKTVRPGDKEFAGLARMLNEFESTIPLYGDHLPPQREHITNNYIKRPHRRGLDLFNWVESSETINHPVLTLQKKLGKILPEPSDKITHSNKEIRDQADPYQLSGPDYDKLKNTVNTFKIDGLTLDQAIRGYMKTPHFKENMAIIEEAESPLDVPMAVDQIMFGDPGRDISGLRQLNQLYIREGTDKFIEELGGKRFEEQKMQKQLRILEYYKKGKEAQEKTESGAFN